MFTVVPKSFFFDRAKVLQKIGAARVKALSKAGSFIRRAAQTSMRYRKKGASAPGQPPFAHKDSGALLRKLLYFSYDPSSDSVVVGPIGKGKAEAPRLNEFGGVVRRRRRGKVFVARYPQRPYMQPALTKSAPKLPKEWANSVLGP